MSWKDLFREMETERKKIKKEEKRKEKEKEREKREHEAVVRKFHDRVDNVIRRFSKATGWEIEEKKYEAGIWQDLGPRGYNESNIEEFVPSFSIRINPSSISFSFRGGQGEIYH